MKSKSYKEFMYEIDKDSLMVGLFVGGYFSKELPDIFTSENFYTIMSGGNSFKDGNIKKLNPTEKSSVPMYHESIRHSNETRTINIPNPFHYYNQCFVLADNFDEIKEHFNQNTEKDSYKVSLNHITKDKNKVGLFEEYDYEGKLLGYKVGETEEMEEEKDILEFYHYEIKLDKKYKVDADISNYYRSIYTHSIVWALIGKSETRRRMSVEREEYYKSWLADIDKLTGNMNEKQTSGVLVGIDSSHLISEIILVSIDNKLRSDKWKFHRYTDDYIVYTDTEKHANDFLILLRKLLKEFNLFLNPKKTKITRLPDTAETAVEEVKQNPYIHLINMNKNLSNNQGVITELFIDSYFKELKKITKKHNDASVIKYGLKVLSKSNMSEEATKIYIMETIHLTLIYPYLIKIIEELILEPYMDILTEKERGIIEKTLGMMYKDAVESNNYEMWMYLLKINLDYPLTILIDHNEILDSNNSLIMLLGYLIVKTPPYTFTEDSNLYIEKAKELSVESEILNPKLKTFQENWLFIYEVLPEKYFCNEWKELKKKKVTFLQKKYADMI